MTAQRGADSLRPPPRAVTTLVLLALVAAATATGFVALGIWQIERRAWKLDLIARISTRIHADPVPAPMPDEWPSVGPASAEYRRVTASGRYVPGHNTQVRGLSELGAGYWLLTPFETTAAFTILVNRGFVLDDKSKDVSEPNGAPQTVTGLLRLTEPGGRFLRANDPATNHWYSRDVRAIAAARHLQRVAPFFIDLDAPTDLAVLPVTGLTVTQFPNNHLQYAVTWFALAAMVVGAAAYVGRYEWRLRQLG